MIHKDLTPERWQRFSLFEQLANVGMDIERTIQWRNKGDADYSQKAFARAIELLDLTIADPKHTKGCIKELTLTREALFDHFVNGNNHASTDEQWQKYFYDFAYAAAIQRGR